MNARTLAVKAGAGPTTWQEPSVYSGGGAEQLYANIIALQESPTRQREIDDAYSRWWLDLVERSGVAKIIREGGVIRSKDYNPEPVLTPIPSFRKHGLTQAQRDQEELMILGEITRPYPPAR